MAAGRRSIPVRNTARAASYPGSSGPITEPLRSARSWSIARRGEGWVVDIGGDSLRGVACFYSARGGNSSPAGGAGYADAGWKISTRVPAGASGRVWGAPRPPAVVVGDFTPPPRGRSGSAGGASTEKGGGV